MSFKLSQEGVKFVKEQLERYETKRSAIIPCLQRVQEENGGWVSEEALEYLSELTKMPLSWILEVFTFYTMFNKKPVGKYHIQVCDNVSCHIAGAKTLIEDLCKHFNVKPGERSEDGKVTITPVECLGACEGAPMAQVNDQYYMNLDKNKLIDLVEKDKKPS